MVVITGGQGSHDLSLPRKVVPIWITSLAVAREDGGVILQSDGQCLLENNEVVFNWAF